MKLKQYALIVLFSITSLSCVEDNNTNPLSNGNEQIVFNENGIPTNCQRYDDGCNTCTVVVLPNGNIDALCTQVNCPAEAYIEPICLDNNPQNQFELETK